jgi:hypothetical protein
VPKPVITHASTFGSASTARHFRSISSNTFWSRAFSTLGLRIVSTATPPVSLRTTASIANGWPDLACSWMQRGTGKPGFFSA